MERYKALLETLHVVGQKPLKVQTFMCLDKLMNFNYNIFFVKLPRIFIPSVERKNPQNNLLRRNKLFFCYYFLNQQKGERITLSAAFSFILCFLYNIDSLNLLVQFFKIEQ